MIDIISVAEIYSFLKYSEDDFVKVGSRGGKSER